MRGGYAVSPHPRRESQQMQIEAGGVTGTSFNGAGQTEELQKLRQEVSDLRRRIDVIVAALAAGATALGVAELRGSQTGGKGKPPALRAGGFFAFRLLWGHRPVEPDQCFFLFLIEGQVSQDHCLEVRRLWQHAEPL